QTEWVPPKFLPTTGKGILFLDELTSAPQMTQAGCSQLVLDPTLGEYELPEDVLRSSHSCASSRICCTRPMPHLMPTPGPLHDHGRWLRTFCAGSPAGRRPPFSQVRASSKHNCSTARWGRLPLRS